MMLIAKARLDSFQPAACKDYLSLLRLVDWNGIETEPVPSSNRDLTLDWCLVLQYNNNLLLMRVVVVALLSS